MSATPLTAEMLADALGCFWNAALGARHNGCSQTSCLVQGVQAVADRLATYATDGGSPNGRDELIVRAGGSFALAEKMAEEAITFIQSVCTQRGDCDKWLVEAHKLNDVVYAFRKAASDAKAVKP